MEFVVIGLVGTGAVLAWFVIAGAVALVAGRMIHERDVHDRPRSRRLRRTRTTPALGR